MEKYNPKSIDLSKNGKLVAKVGYEKGQFITELDKISDIVLNGGQVEMKAQEIREIDGQQVQVMSVNIYFVSS